MSLEVSPHLAHDTAGTIKEAKILWDKLARPNALIKIPGTPEGLPAVEETLAAGINVNVTLLFSIAAYEAVAKAYIRALKRCADAGKPIDRIASVASFFVSRIDTEVDKRIDAKLKTEPDPTRKKQLESLHGKIAIANAKNAYGIFQNLFSGADFTGLKAKGAASSAGPLGVSWDEESEVPGHALYRRTRRTGYGVNDASANARRRSRPRQGAP